MLLRNTLLLLPALIFTDAIPIEEGRRRPVYSSSSTPSSERYLHRLKKYDPPRHINTGIKSIKIPEQYLYDQGRRMSMKKGSSVRRGNNKKNIEIVVSLSETDSSVSSSSKSSYSSYSSTTKTSSRPNRNGCRKRHSHKRHRCRDKKCCPKQKRLMVKSSSSSSSHSRSVSVETNFSQEDAALLGRCDRPALAFHHRHYSRRLRRDENSNSRDRTRVN